MSDPTVTAYLTKLLCSNGGRLERDRLAELLSLSAEQIQQILQYESQRFPESAQLVLAQSPLRICPRYLKGDSEGCGVEEDKCPRLHLCRHYLRGHCLRTRCRYSHDMFSDHNLAVLKANEVSGLNEKEIKVLLFQNDSQLLPEHCKKYMEDNCDQGVNCTRLHVCNFFTYRGCNSHICRKSHSLLDSTLLMTCNWLSAEAIQNFQMLCVIRQNQNHGNNMARRGRGVQRGRGRGRGRGRSRRREGSLDLLDGRSRERGEGFGSRPRFSSRPPSRCSGGQNSGDEDLDGSESDSDHSSRQPKSRLNNLMEDWFSSSPKEPRKTQGNSSDPSTQARPEERRARPEPSTKKLDLSPNMNEPPSRSSAASHTVQPTEVKNSKKIPEFTRTLSSTSNVEKDQSNTLRTEPLTFGKSYSTPTHVKPTFVPLVSPVQQPPVNVPPYIPMNPVMTPTLLDTPLNYSGSPFTLQPKPVAGSVSRLGTVPIQSTPQPTHSSALNRTENSSVEDQLSAARIRPSIPPRPSLTSSISDISSIKDVPSSNPKSIIELKNSTSSPVAGLYSGPSISSSTPRTPLYSTMNVPFTAQSTAVTSAWSSELSTSSSLLKNTNSYSAQTTTSARADTSSGKVLATVKPLQKTRSEDVNLFLLGYEKRQDLTPPMNVPSVLPKPSPEITPEICLPHIWKNCWRKGCTNLHFYLPYCWQEFTGAEWKDLANNEDIERAYSDPKNNRYQSIDFQTMKLGGRNVRRLSTTSSVTRPPEYVLTTEWIWYWKDEYGTWTEYGQSNAKNVSAGILSSDLESIYLSDPTATIPFTAGSQNYLINFREMKQRNTHYLTEKEVCRRPKFLDFQSVNLLKGSTKSTATTARQAPSVSPLKTENYPQEWDPSAIPEIGYKKVLVAQNSREFINIVTIFKKTVSGHEVKKLWRVQNSSLWQIYQWHKDQMKKKNPGQNVVERQLFHGTIFANTDGICKDNFDWRICGTNGTVYGQGSYFARDASYSHNYSQPTSTGVRSMFLARVLVGDFVKGDSTMRRPPQKTNSTQSYDSCVDNISNPSIFVVFERFQAYPEYLLEYAEEKSSSCVIS
ncbi:zinc finger CCCH-type antiviral protein 1-like [Hyperolius riggenbachi]|uniref:zinc finger CCCH-type antiviral protein 1-like n=1 Tax=Hyperolius riggenbachi TaxID=752182 RepID=UPI0035A3186B